MNSLKNFLSELQRMEKSIIRCAEIIENKVLSFPFNQDREIALHIQSLSAHISLLSTHFDLVTHGIARILDRQGENSTMKL